MRRSGRTMVMLVVAGALVLSACTDGGDGGDGGTGGRTVVVSSDLPLRGTAAETSQSTNRMLQVYLDRVGRRAGSHSVQFATYDDSASEDGSWDEATCSANAEKHAANAAEIAVVGTYNSECTKVMLPILERAQGGSMVMVSHANTNPGLTKAWAEGEPEVHYPSGERNFARVIATDDAQGTAAARFASERLSVRRVMILNDGQTYGEGVAASFKKEAARLGLEVVAEEVWDGEQKSYTSQFAAAKEQAPELVYLAGIFGNNGAQLIKDKVAVLGNNQGVKLMGPDGFAGYADLQALAQGEGMYLTFAGLSADQLVNAGGQTRDLLDAYAEEYPDAAITSYSLYGVAALQVILAAVASSDGTREGVRKAIFSGEGITIPAEDSAIGREIRIDPETGDVLTQDVSVLQLTQGQEVLVQVATMS